MTSIIESGSWALPMIYQTYCDAGRSTCLAPHLPQPFRCLSLTPKYPYYDRFRLHDRPKLRSIGPCANGKRRYGQQHPIAARVLGATMATTLVCPAAACLKRLRAAGQNRILQIERSVKSDREDQPLRCISAIPKFPYYDLFRLHERGKRRSNYPVRQRYSETRTMIEPKFLTTKEVADRYRGTISIGTLKNWRSLRIGPSFVKLGKTILYPVEHLDRWDQENFVTCHAPKGGRATGREQS